MDSAPDGGRLWLIFKPHSQGRVWNKTFIHNLSWWLSEREAKAKQCSTNKVAVIVSPYVD
jgi:hypothetical protein